MQSMGLQSRTHLSNCTELNGNTDIENSLMDTEGKERAGRLERAARKHMHSAQLSRSVVSDSLQQWAAARQASLSITSSWSPPKPMSIASVMPSNHLILCRPLFLPPSIFPRIRVFSSEPALRIRWPKYWSFSLSICPSNEYSGLISFRWAGWISLQSKGLSRVFSNTTVQKLDHRSKAGSQF